MGNLSISNGGISTNKEGMASIDLRYGPYASVSAAHASLAAEERCAVGLTVGIINGTSITEYWYQGGTSESNLVKKQSDVTIDAYTKDESDNKYQPAGDYATKTELNGKVDNVLGKGLSTNDYTNEDKNKVANALVPADIAGKANASDVYTKSETYTKTEVNGLVDTPHEEYVTVDAYSNLPATGSKDTIYRVSNYNGSTSQVDANVYSQYAWDGTQYVFLCVKSQIDEVFDISVYNNNAKYADLAAALNGGNNIPQSLRKGGMYVKFIQSSDSKYVQYMLTKQTWSTTASDWEKMNLEKEVKENTESLQSLRSSILPYTTMNGYYVTNAGVVTDLGNQNTFYVAVSKGTKLTAKVHVSANLTLRWGAFADVPVLNAQAFYYNHKDVSAETTYELQHTATQDEYFAISGNASAISSISFETEGILDKIVLEISELQTQVNNDSEYINRLREEIGDGAEAIVMEDGYYAFGSASVGDIYTEFHYPSGTYKCAKIACQGGDVFTINASAGDTAGLYIFTDSENRILEKKGRTTVSELPVTAPLGSAYLYLNDNSNSTSYKGEEDNITKLQKDVTRLDGKFHFDGLSSAFSLAASASKTLGEIYVRKNSRVSLEVGEFTSFRFGLGYNKYMGYWIEVNSTTVSVYKYVSGATQVTSYSHGLNVSAGIKVSIVAAEDTASFILIDSFGTLSKTDNVDWWGGGAAFVTNLGSSTIEGNIAYFAGDITKKIWLFGDSYLSYNQTARWLYYMVNWGFKNWLANHLPGVNSASSIAPFDNLTGLGMPQYIVWALGMNDGSDANSSTPNANWLSAVQHVIDYCESNSITPILCTIPSVPNIYHEGKNNYVRNSGYRYIDFAKAVNAQADGTWTTGLLSTDNVHPTDAGAKVLASQALIDFPEILVSD